LAGKSVVVVAVVGVAVVAVVSCGMVVLCYGVVHVSDFRCTKGAKVAPAVIVALIFLQFSWLLHSCCCQLLQVASCRNAALPQCQRR